MLSWQLEMRLEFKGKVQSEDINLGINLCKNMLNYGTAWDHVGREKVEKR